MPHLTSHDGVRLHYEEVGQGLPLVFVHEFLGEIHVHRNFKRPLESPRELELGG